MWFLLKNNEKLIKICVESEKKNQFLINFYLKLIKILIKNQFLSINYEISLKITKNALKNFKKNIFNPKMPAKFL